MDKKEIIEKHWPKPSQCSISSVMVMQEAIGKMMDEWAGSLIQNSKSITSTFNIPTTVMEQIINLFGEYKLTNDLKHDRGVNPDWGQLSYGSQVKKFIQEVVNNNQ